MFSRYDHRDAVVVITGASSGIGEATARAFARRGSRLVLAARGAKKLAALRDELSPDGSRAVAVVTDITEQIQAERMVGAAIEQFGRIDVLINNAGVGAFGQVDTLSPEIVKQVIDTNLMGAIWSTQAALPYMRQQGKGQIIDITSILGRVSLPGRELYCASKHALHAWSDALRLSVRHVGIDVITVDPGPVATPFHANRLDSGSAIGGILEVPADKVARTIVRMSYLRKRKSKLVGIGAMALSAIYGLSPSIAAWFTRRADSRMRAESKS